MLPVLAEGEPKDECRKEPVCRSSDFGTVLLMDLGQEGRKKDLEGFCFVAGKKRR